MMDYNHWAAIAPARRNPPARRQPRRARRGAAICFGLRVAKVTFNLHDNDHKLIAFGKNKVMEAMRAAGAEEVVQESRFANLVGAARMGDDPATARWSTASAAATTSPNLFVCDGSILPTQGSANPGLTIQALAERTADYLVHRGDAIFRRTPRPPGPEEAPPIRRDLSPPDTFGHGMPHEH